MNYMLYIIAVLIMISIIAVLLLLKNKAQKPSAPPQIQNDNKDTETPATPAPTDMLHPTTAATADSGATKFDSLTIAQRFIDQQRHDKAIDTLKRGLISKPNDSQLMLKLLNVYAITSQTDDFNEVYALISTHGDDVTIEQAKNLKILIDEEIEQEQAVNAPVVEEDDGDTSYGSLDFEMPTENPQEKPAAPSAPEAIPTLSNSDAFDLTLDDLEDVSADTLALDSVDTSPIDTTPSAAIAPTENKVPVVETPISDSPAPDNQKDEYAADNIDDDFTFDFDAPVEELVVEKAIIEELVVEELEEESVIEEWIVEQPVESTENKDLSSDAPVEELAIEPISVVEQSTESTHDTDLSDDDFILDFGDLSEDTLADDTKISSENHDMATKTPVVKESFDDDFSLFLDETESDTKESDTKETIKVTATANTDIDLKDNDFEFDGLENDIFDISEPEVDTDILEKSEPEAAVSAENFLGNGFEDTIAQLDAFTLEAQSSESIADAQPQEPQKTVVPEPVNEPYTFDTTIIDAKNTDVCIETEVIENNPTATPEVDDSILSFNDNTATEDLDLTFDAVAEIETPIPAAPVSTTEAAIEADVQSVDNQAATTLPVTGASQQFSADFDFVKSLDNHQVTLDLAEQYLQLGEYDSAKRLLNEVMTQGNHGQQQQARILLARTA